MRRWLVGFNAAMVVFMLAPLLMIVLMSFTPAGGFELPGWHWSLRWYRAVFAYPGFIDAFFLSLRLGLATATIATALAFGAVWTLQRRLVPGVTLLDLFFMSPLLVPAVVFGVAMLQFLNRHGLYNSFIGLLLAHVVVVLPFVVRVVAAALRDVPRQLEWAALSLGANMPRALLARDAASEPARRGRRVPVRLYRVVRRGNGDLVHHRPRLSDAAGAALQLPDGPGGPNRGRGIRHADLPVALPDPCTGSAGRVQDDAPVKETTMQPRLTVDQILHPRSVGVIGASDDVAKFGGRIMHYLVKHRFPGSIVPINPSRAEVRGIRTFPRIGEAPGPVDVCILAVPASVLVQSVRECAEAGVGCCVIMTTGFAEIGPVGRARQDELELIARTHRMRILGPNCMGLINPHHALALTSSLVLEEGELACGRIGLISQSGALMVSMYDRAHSAGIGFSACVSLGNQSDVEICDILEYMRDDPRTEAICLYVEGFRSPRRFLELAQACRGAGKPVLMVKSGRTEAGVRAALSHTASLAGSYRVLSSACTEHGVLLLDDPDDMIRAADALLRWGVPRTDGVAVLSPSGGGAAVMIDRISERGIRPAMFNEATRTKLAKRLLPSFIGNPIDLGGRLDSGSTDLGGQLYMSWRMIRMLAHCSCC